jgi:beta-galactosidase
LFYFQGQAFINGFNLGRYWPVAGPQVTLYVPAGVLRAPPSRNYVVMFELESSPSSRDPNAVNTIEFVDKPVINSRCFARTNMEKL